MSTRFEMVKMKDTGLRRIISHVSTKGKHHIILNFVLCLSFGGLLISFYLGFGCQIKLSKHCS